ncbi:hypothetical protein ACFTRD_23315 [Paenibacillus sp. NPDC056933]|uniref:hypothetical protein n=1 Tax=Paenibacillus sp. NPDC056933 TaxID=3345968 RepID=UPI0036429FB2
MTQLISQRIYQFFHLFPIYPHLLKVLAMCPEGEHHQVGLLLFSLFMRKNGAEVLYLEANTPEEGYSNYSGKCPKIQRIVNRGWDVSIWQIGRRDLGIDSYVSKDSSLNKCIGQCIQDIL